MSISGGTLRLWLLHLIANAFLVFGVYAWLSIGDANAAQLTGTVIYGLVIAFLLVWLHAGTFRYFGARPRDARLRIAYWNVLPAVAPFALICFAAAVVYALFSRAGDQASDTAATIASWLTLKLRHPVKPVAIGRVLLWILRIAEWFGAPLLFIPLASSVALRRWRGFGPTRFNTLRRRYALLCPALLLAAFFVPDLIANWVPGLHGVTLQTISAVVRFTVAWLILITAWLALIRETALRDAPAASVSETPAPPPAHVA
jgi:hypothetical protein